MALTLNILDIGMGDGTYIELPMPGGAHPKTCLIDYGEYWTPNRDAPTACLTYMIEAIGQNCVDRGRTSPHLDFLFLTHCDLDHWCRLYNLINGCAERDSKGPLNSDLWYQHFKHDFKRGAQLTIGEVYYGGAWSDYEHKRQSDADLIRSKTTKELIDLPDNEYDWPDGSGNVTPRWASLGGSNVNIYLLSCNNPKKAGNKPNPNSLVLMIEQNGAKFIIPGDAEGEIEAKIVDRYKDSKLSLKCDGMRMGHHGSVKGTSEIWVEATLPKSVFVSSDSKWGHPYYEAVRRIYEHKPPCLATSTDYRYFVCSGLKGGDWFVTRTQSYMCTTLWYFVTDAGGKTLKDYDGVSKLQPLGMVTGVQYSVTIPIGSIALGVTDAWPDPNNNP